MSVIYPESQLEEIYSPDEDTFLLLKAALKEASLKDHVLEIGCGSGLISGELAGQVESLLATDINPHAVRAAKKRSVEVVRADLFGGIREVQPDHIQSALPSHQTRGENDQWINYALTVVRRQETINF